MALFKKKKEEQKEDFIDKLSRQEFIKAETKFRHNNIRKFIGTTITGCKGKCLYAEAYLPQ